MLATRRPQVPASLGLILKAQYDQRQAGPVAAATPTRLCALKQSKPNKIKSDAKGGQHLLLTHWAAPALPVDHTGVPSKMAGQMTPQSDFCRSALLLRRRIVESLGTAPRLICFVSYERANVCRC